MRSHAFRALAALCATSALLACGEAVDVGTFDDGTGGAGGGDLATTGAPTSTPSSSGAGGDPGTGGDDTTASTGTGGEDPTPNTFQLAAIQAAVDTHILVGLFVHGTLAEEQVCEDLQSVGACTLKRCDLVEIEQQVKRDAGEVTVRSTHGELSGENDAEAGYQIYGDGPLYDPGATVTFEVEGAGDIPAFTADVSAPLPIQNAVSLAAAARTPTGDDLTVSWEPVAAGTHSISFQRVEDEGSGSVIRCEVTGTEGTLVVAGSLLVAAAEESPLMTGTSLQISNARALTAGTYEGLVGAVDIFHPGSVCGGLGDVGCNEDEYCDWPDDICGGDDSTGICTPRPTDCASDQEGPACSCSGENFPSVCEAAQHGVDVWGGEEGCSPPVFCGGVGGGECEADEFCDYRNDLCGTADESGVCRSRPTSCPEPNADEVVCGCVFGDTFGSECLANQAGQDVGPGDGLECGGA